jgi:ElaB/YqjD/DUF883 family membrane-anchored ribosome-binding protein
MKSKIRETSHLEDSLSALSKQVNILKQENEKSEIEKKEVKKYAHELLEKVKKDMEA